VAGALSRRAVRPVPSSKGSSTCASAYSLLHWVHRRKGRRAPTRKEQGHEPREVVRRRRNVVGHANSYAAPATHDPCMMPLWTSRTSCADGAGAVLDTLPMVPSAVVLPDYDAFTTIASTVPSTSRFASMSCGAPETKRVSRKARTV